MNFTTQSSSDEFMQYGLYQMESKGFHDQATEDEERIKMKGQKLSSPENSCTDYADLDQKNSKGKANKRRSRASKKTPMILLNADTRNFRALVQQFTGCQSAPSSSFKGPINLNFGGGNDQENDHMDIVTDNHDQSAGIFGSYNNSFVQNDDHFHVHDQQVMRLEDHDQERLLSSGSLEGVLSADQETYAMNNMVNIGVENNFFHDFSGDFSSNVLPDDDFFF